jgi:hypothetical protein
MAVLVSKIQAIVGVPPAPHPNASNQKPGCDWDYEQIWNSCMDAIYFLGNTEKNIADYEKMSEILNQSIIDRLDQSISHLVFIRDLVVNSGDKIPF